MMELWRLGLQVDSISFAIPYTQESQPEISKDTDMRISRKIAPPEGAIPEQVTADDMLWPAFSDNGRQKLKIAAYSQTIPKPTTITTVSLDISDTPFLTAYDNNLDTWTLVRASEANKVFLGIMSVKT